MRVHFLHGCAECSAVTQAEHGLKWTGEHVAELALRDWAACSHCAALYVAIRRIGAVTDGGPVVSMLVLLQVPTIALRPRLREMSNADKTVLLEALQQIACLRRTPPAKRGQA